MGSKTSRKAHPNTKKRVNLNHAAKKRHQRLSKDQAERVRDALNHDVDLLYNTLKHTSTASPSAPQTNPVISLAESMLDLGR